MTKIKEKINSQDKKIILGCFQKIKDLAGKGKKSEALDLLLDVRKDVSSDVVEEMFELFNQPGLINISLETSKSIPELQENYLKECDRIRKFLSEEKVKKLLNYVVPLPNPFEEPNSTLDFLLNIINLYPTCVCQFFIDRAEYALKNKFDRSCYSIFSNFFHRHNFPTEFLEKLYLCKERQNLVKNWIRQNDDGTEIFNYCKKEIEKWLLNKKKDNSEKANKKRKELNFQTQNTFEEPKKLIKQIADGMFRSKNQILKLRDNFQTEVDKAFNNTSNLSKEEINHARSEWRTSRELDLLEKEINPIFQIFCRIPNMQWYEPDNQLLKNEYIINLLPPINGCGNASSFYIKLSPLNLDEKVQKPNKVCFCGREEDGLPFDGIIQFEDESEQKIEATIADRDEHYAEEKDNLKHSGVAAFAQNNIGEKCIIAIKNKFRDKHKNKYEECWLVVTFTGSIKNENEIEDFLVDFNDSLKNSINWNKVRSIIICPQFNR